MLPDEEIPHLVPQRVSTSSDAIKKPANKNGERNFAVATYTIPRKRDLRCPRARIDLRSKFVVGLEGP